MLKVEIPKDKAKTKRQIAALEYVLKTDNEKDRKIHLEALNDLRKALESNF